MARKSENGASDIEFTVEVRCAIRRIEAELEHLKELLAADTHGQRRRRSKGDERPLLGEPDFSEVDPAAK
jgi:hypothetical protein